MIFNSTPIDGAYLIDLEKRCDERGFFARSFCREEFGRMGLETCFPQMNVSYNRARWTMRGMHYQEQPASEVKIVTCMSGALFDVVLDLRRQSASYAEWFGAELSSANRRMMYVPAGCAHGFLTLADNTDVLYLMSASHAPNLERGIRWNDPHFRIRWPHEPSVISARDREFADYAPNGNILASSLEPAQHA